MSPVALYGKEKRMGIQQYLEIGKIVNTHGVKGDVKVISLTDNPERYNDLKWVFIDKKTQLEKYHIEHIKFFKQSVIIKFAGINDMNSAESLIGLFLKVDRKNSVKLPEGSYLICDLIDCEVFDVNSKKLGILKDVLKTGSNDVYVVEDDGGKQILIPALKSVVKEVCVEEGRIIVLLPEGLIDDEI